MGWWGAAVRRSRAGLLAIGVVSLAAVAVAACGGGGGGGSANTTPGATPSPTQAPQLQPTVVGSSFNFPGHGYFVTIPDGYHANPNSLLAGPQTVDTFFAADTVDGIQPNVSVTCELNPTHIATQQFVTQRMATLNALGAAQVTNLGTITVSGVQAQKIGYNLVRGDLSISKIDVMFATRRCGWTLAAGSAASTLSQTTSTFDKFLASFRLTDDATPAAGSTPSAATPAAAATGSSAG